MITAQPMTLKNSRTGRKLGFVGALFGKAQKGSESDKKAPKVAPDAVFQRPSQVWPGAKQAQLLARPPSAP